MAVTAGYNTSIEITGTSTAFGSNQTLTQVGSTDVWRLDDADKNIFDPEANFTVEVSEDSGMNWTAIGQAEFTNLYLVGAVDIDSYTSLSGNTANITDVRITAGSYLPQYTVVQGRSAGLSSEYGAPDSTVFSNSSRGRIYGLHDVSINFESIDSEDPELDAPTTTTEATLTEILLQSTQKFVVFSYDHDGNETRLERASVILTEQSLEMPVDDVVSKTITGAGSLIPAADTNQSSRNFYVLKT